MSASGYRVTLTAWLTCGHSLEQMLDAQRRLAILEGQGVMLGLSDVAIETEFQKFRRRERGVASSGPPEAASSPASAPPEPQAPGAGGAAEESPAGIGVARNSSVAPRPEDEADRDGDPNRQGRATPSADGAAEEATA